MLNDVEFEARLDQLSQLDVLIPQSEEGYVNVKFTISFVKRFGKKFRHTLKTSDSFEDALILTSVIVLYETHPEISKRDLFELGKLCGFVWGNYYHVTEKKYKKFWSED